MYIGRLKVHKSVLKSIKAAKSMQAILQSILTVSQSILVALKILSVFFEKY